MLVAEAASMGAYSDDAVAARTIIGARFLVRQTLGRGGMAAVYEVEDQQTGKARALKRLDRSADPKKQQRAAQLFEREFHTLCQLAHPRVVQVHDYAVDDEGPYYTMELLDGGDLQQIAPVPWRQACAIARDVCSALSLLHSRRTVHRDVSPRNVRRAPDGSAKLIDFGAMAPMGPCKIVMGTPPCCAPEILHMQTLDARTDLYALGATLYYTLVGRHAYPARNFGSLSEFWLTPVPHPSQLVAGVPPALDALVLDLLRLDPDARPSSAAEVMLRLSAIDGCAPDESLLVAQSYLSTPTLVGRERHLTRVRLKIKRAMQWHGSAIAIQGASGVGRSRLLNACVLEATLLGARVIRSDADQALAGDYGVLRTIIRELLQTMPEAVLATARPKLALLAHAVPELVSLTPQLVLEDIDAAVLRSQLQPALREWLFALSGVQPLVIAIDDFQRIDEPSATLFALSALEVRDRAICLIASIETGAPSVSDAVCKLFNEAASKIILANLSDHDTQLLLCSLFGDTPNLDMLAHRLYGLAAGNPRDVMRLAQHLLDRALVRYRAGAWTLPAALDEADLPPSIQQAQRARIDTLSAGARELASTFALCPDLGFSLQECVELMGRAAGQDASLELEELIKADIAREAHDNFALAQRAWATVLRTALSPEELQRLHARLAETLAARGNQTFRVAQHLLLAGELDRGLDELVAHASASQENTAQGADRFFKYAQSLPPDWLSVFARAVRLCAERGRPARQRFALLSRLAGILAMFAIDDKLHLQALLHELERYSGLEAWAELDASLPAMPRLMKALEQTQARYVATPEAERVLDPATAIRQLGRAVISASALAAMSLEVRDVRSLPSLVPLVPLSPALGVIDLLIQGMRARYTARFEYALALYKQLLERTAQPDGGGLDASHGRYMRMGVMNGVGMIEAGLGLASCLDYAQQLERDPSHCVNALQIRMLYALWQGDSVTAAGCKRDVDRIRVQNSARHWFEGSHLLWELTAYVLSDDLTRIKHIIEELAPLQQRYPAWVPVARYATAQYQRVRGDYASALIEVEAALAMTSVADHQTWIHLATTHLQVLTGLGRDEEALGLGAAYLEQAASAELGYTQEYLRMTLAVVQAKHGQHEAARASADRALEVFGALNTTGLNLGLAYEARARVAALADEPADFERYAAGCRQVFCGRKNRSLIAKYEKLMLDARRSVAGPGAHGALELPSKLLSDTGVGSVFRTCVSAAERASVALTLLQQQSGANDGYLFALGASGPECVARLADTEPPDTVIAMVRAYLAREMNGAVTTATDGESEVLSSATEWLGGEGQKYRAVLLSHQTSDALVITGVAVLVTPLGRPFSFPAQIASTLSRHTCEAGDHSVMVTH